MMKQVWILGAVAHRKTIVPISRLNMLRSDCNSDTSRWESQKWDVILLTWLCCWKNFAVVVAFHFLWNYWWCIYIERRITSSVEANQTFTNACSLPTPNYFYFPKQEIFRHLHPWVVVTTYFEKVLLDMWMWKCLPVNRTTQLLRMCLWHGHSLSWKWFWCTQNQVAIWSLRASPSTCEAVWATHGM